VNDTFQVTEIQKFRKGDGKLAKSSRLSYGPVTRNCGDQIRVDEKDSGEGMGVQNVRKM
jgi:hypothetical protein